MTKRHVIAVLRRVVEDQAATIERLQAARRCDATRHAAEHESTLRELDRARIRIAILETTTAVDDAYADIFAGYEDPT